MKFKVKVYRKWCRRYREEERTEFIAEARNQDALREYLEDEGEGQDFLEELEYEEIGYNDCVGADVMEETIVIEEWPYEYPGDQGKVDLEVPDEAEQG